MSADVVKLFVERRVMWNDNAECRDQMPGGWNIGPALKGSSVVHFCDRPHDHTGDHFNAELRKSWPPNRPAEAMA